MYVWASNRSRLTCVLVSPTPMWEMALSFDQSIDRSLLLICLTCLIWEGEERERKMRARSGEGGVRGRRRERERDEGGRWGGRGVRGRGGEGGVRGRGEPTMLC